MNDRKIVDKLKKGDYSVFKYLYAHFSMIEKYIINNSGSKDDAEDIFQNALIVLYKNTKKSDFELTSKIGTYLYSIAKNLWLKKITRNKETPSSEGFEHLVEQERSYESDQTNSPENYLNALLKKVGDPCKTLIIYFHFDKLSWDVIAEKLNYKNAHAARQQKYKCFLKIRKLIPEADKLRLLNYGS